MINIPSNVLRLIFVQLPDEAICNLYSVCKKFQEVIKGNNTYQPLIDKKFYCTHKIVARFGAINGDEKIKFTLNNHCYPVLKEVSFFKSIFSKNHCTQERVQWVVKQINDFAEHAVKSAKKDTVSSMFLALQRIQFARKALHQIDWIAYHQGIKNSNIDHKKLETLASRENWGLKKTLIINEKPMNFSVCLADASPKGFHGTILIDNALQHASVDFGTKIENQDHVIFSIKSSMSSLLKTAVKKEIALLAKELPCKEFSIEEKL